MSKKVILQLVVIIAAFGAAAYVLYNGFNKTSVLVTVPVNSEAAVQTPQAILPYGGEPFNFNFLNSRPFVYDQIQYQNLDPSGEVGIPVSNLIANPTTPH